MIEAHHGFLIQERRQRPERNEVQSKGAALCARTAPFDCGRKQRGLRSGCSA
jgi:hypothetical protein